MSTLVDAAAILVVTNIFTWVWEQYGQRVAGTVAERAWERV